MYTFHAPGIPSFHDHTSSPPEQGHVLAMHDLDGFDLVSGGRWRRGKVRGRGRRGKKRGVGWLSSYDNRSVGH